MTNRIILLTFISLLFIQCNFKIEGEIKYVFKLTSPNRQIEIYECFIESPMAFGSGNIETTILKAGEKYNPRHSGNFNEYEILGWIGDDTLKVIKFHKKDENKIKIPEAKLHEIKKWGDFYLDITHRTSYGGGQSWFSFDSLYFTSDSVYFLHKDSLGIINETLGLLKGQIRLSLDSDIISIINGNYHERIEDHFDKITEGNEFGYPFVVGTNCEITPKYRLESSTFNEQAITKELDIKNFR